MDTMHLMQEAALKAGNRLSELFMTQLTVQDKKSHQDIVTEADTQSQQIIQDTIIQGMIELGYKQEEVGFIGEEELTIKGMHTFIIDPLDGTTSFAAGLPYFCISIAYMKDGEVLTGVVYDPTHKTYYIAEKGNGTFKLVDDKNVDLKIKERDLKSMIVAAHFNNPEEVWQKQFKIYSKYIH